MEENNVVEKRQQLSKEGLMKYEEELIFRAKKEKKLHKKMIMSTLKFVSFYAFIKNYFQK